ncbi:type II toxin-antitoxin system RelE/ParE family toxin [Rouxiella sp. Mn2063]|uniref:type II toxin-antitoxin system RelE/ParE family toxin n=1 Tax=Rouxiella sp. Mn2063 TaxID=3395262 RepID=UPI003BE98441
MSYIDSRYSKLEYDARLLREPDSEPLGEGLFEIRTMGTDISRGIWVYHKNNSIIILRVFIKKSPKTPAEEIYPSYLKLLLRWLRSLTRITYLSK